MELTTAIKITNRTKEKEVSLFTQFVDFLKLKQFSLRDKLSILVKIIATG